MRGLLRSGKAIKLGGKDRAAGCGGAQIIPKKIDRRLFVQRQDRKAHFCEARINSLGCRSERSQAPR